MKKRVKRFAKSHLVLSTAVAALLSGAVLTTAVAVTPSATETSSKTLTPDQITQQLLAQGYSNVIRMEMEDGQYEVKVKTKDGKRESLNVDPATGKVLGKHQDSFWSN